MIKINNAPFMWQSKATSVTFASERIGEAHAEMSSGSVGIYATGNATLDSMEISYAAEEMGVNFPFPFTLKMENNTATNILAGHRPQNQIQTRRLLPRMGSDTPQQGSDGTRVR